MYLLTYLFIIYTIGCVDAMTEGLNDLNPLPLKYAFLRLFIKFINPELLTLKAPKATIVVCHMRTVKFQVRLPHPRNLTLELHCPLIS